MHFLLNVQLIITKKQSFISVFFFNLFHQFVVSNLPSSSHNSTEFDDPALIQNIEKNHVGPSDRWPILDFLNQSEWVAGKFLFLWVFKLSAHITSDLWVFDDDGGVPHGGTRAGRQPDHLPSILTRWRSAGQRCQGSWLCLHSEDATFSYNRSCESLHLFPRIPAAFQADADIFCIFQRGKEMTYELLNVLEFSR